MPEQWKDIKSHPNYQVSSLGRVRVRRTGKLIAIWFTKDGYRKVTLYRNGKKNNLRCARLVCIMFLGIDENKPFADHINHMRDDDRLENLRWSSWCENEANKRTYRRYHDKTA